MDENHQDETRSKLVATENKLWLPPLSPKDQEKLDRLHSNPKKAVIKGTGFSGKTLWDWLQLLIIPFILAVGGFWFSAQQNQFSLQTSERQHQTDIQIAEDQQRETTLKTCMDDMKDLLLNKGLRASKPEDEVRIVARAEVLSALRQLDGERKGTLIQFLSESGLITSEIGPNGRNMIIRNNVIIATGTPIIDLTDANLTGANLTGADLGGADLTDANLTGANLFGASLMHANLVVANLSGADLTYADLYSVTVTQEQLAQAWSLRRATMPDGSIHP